MEKDFNKLLNIDMKKLEQMFGAAASVLYGATKETELFVKAMMFKTSCARIAATYETCNFHLVMRNLNMEKNGLNHIIKYIRFLNPNLTEAQVFVIETGFEEYKKLYKQVRGNTKEE